MKLQLTPAKKSATAPVEIDTEAVQLITPMDNGTIRIVTDKDVFYVKETLQEIALKRAGVDSPEKLQQLRDQIAILNKEVSDLMGQLSSKRTELIRLEREYDHLFQKVRAAIDNLESGPAPMARPPLPEHLLHMLYNGDGRIVFL